MSFHLEPDEIAALTSKPDALDPGVLAVKVTMRPDYAGADALHFRVVLKDALKMTKPSLKMGRRLQKIATSLGERAAAMGLPFFGSVEFVIKSELAQLERRPV